MLSNINYNNMSHNTKTEQLNKSQLDYIVTQLTQLNINNDVNIKMKNIKYLFESLMEKVIYVDNEENNYNSNKYYLKSTDGNIDKLLVNIIDKLFELINLVDINIYVTYEPCIIIYSKKGKVITNSQNYSRDLKNNLIEQVLIPLKLQLHTETEIKEIYKFPINDFIVSKITSSFDNIRYILPRFISHMDHSNTCTPVNTHDKNIFLEIKRKYEYILTKLIFLDIKKINEYNKFCEYENLRQKFIV